MFLGRTEYFVRPMLRHPVKVRITNTLRGRLSPYEASRIALASFIYRRIAFADERMTIAALREHLQLAEAPPPLPAGPLIFIGGLTIFHRALAEALSRQLQGDAKAEMHLIPPPSKTPQQATAQVESILLRARDKQAKTFLVRFQRMGAHLARLHLEPLMPGTAGAALERTLRHLEDALSENPAQFDWFAEPEITRLYPLPLK